MAEVRFDHVTKQFGDVLAVNDVSLEIPDGEFLVLVGPSGCGKSTALRVLAGLEEITSGRIYIGERRVDTISAKDRDIAMVFQTYALYPHMSVSDNMAFGLKLRKRPKPEIVRRVQDAAEILGLMDLLDRKPRQLSGGQRQRVALGRAIVRDPAVFLLDEPLSNLDAKLRVQTRAELRKLYERLGSTFIYVTHDQVEAMTMATRIAVMNEGRLQQVGAPQRLYDAPANIFVAGFIGSPAMNLFEADVRRLDDGLQFDGDHVQLPVPDTLRESLGEYEGRRVVVGIRPEHIHAIDYQPSGITPWQLTADVDLVEMMGNETFLHLQFDGTPLLARVDPRASARSGDRATVVADIRHLHVFDPETDAAIGHATENHAVR